jgi:hypothetical protein
MIYGAAKLATAVEQLALRWLRLGLEPRPSERLVVTHTGAEFLRHLVLPTCEIAGENKSRRTSRAQACKNKNWTVTEIAIDFKEIACSVKSIPCLWIQNSLLSASGKCSLSASHYGATSPRLSDKRWKSGEIPCIFPAYQGNGLETGSLRTTSTATQSEVLRGSGECSKGTAVFRRIRGYFREQFLSERQYSPVLSRDPRIFLWPRFGGSVREHRNNYA